MSSLESSVTLEDVFSVVEAKRVPLAPELAGYLSLEIADGSQTAGGDVDSRTVYISEEGTVALVRPKKDGPIRDPEASIRAILATLLEASGSATPALTAASKRRAGAGVPALVSELEAALIPVNRAAGRRALARLAREVKRVTLGVGRNASVPAPARSQPPPARPKDDVMSGPDAPPGPRPSFTDEAVTARRGNQFVDLPGTQVNALDIIGALPLEPPQKGGPPVDLTPPPLPGAPPGLAPPPWASPAPPPAALPAPPPFVAAPPPVAPPRLAPPPRAAAGLPLPPTRGAVPVVAPPPRGGKAGERLFGGDEVDSLLSTFEVSNVGEQQVRSDLKAIAGLDPTPAPPDATTLADLTRDVGKGLPPTTERAERDSLEALLDLAPGAAPGGADRGGPGAAPLDLSFGAPLGDAGLSAGLESPPDVASSAEAGAYDRQPGAPIPPLGPPTPGIPLPPRSAPFPPPPESEGALPAPPRGAGRATGAVRTTKASEPPARPATVNRAKATGGAVKKTGGAGYRQPRAPRTGLLMLALTLVVLVGGGIAVWMFQPAFFTGRKRPAASASVSAASPGSAGSAGALPAQPPAVAARCKVALVVSDVPPNAEILLRMGQSPLDVERMPVGTRLEFVATAEGYAPRRAVIKAEATWDKAPDAKPRIDVPVQLEPTKAKPGSVDPWPAAEPGNLGGKGSPGTVHLVSSVRGAEVWLLVGLGPETRIEQLRCDGDIDVLLAGPPQLRKRLHVAEKEIQAVAADADGTRLVSVSAK